MWRRYKICCYQQPLAEILGIQSVPLDGAAEVLPLAEAPVVIQRISEPPRLELLHWGLVPWWSQDQRSAMSLLTAPLDLAGALPEIRPALQARRCLVPAVAGSWNGADATPALPQPDAPSQTMLAGVWECWRPQGAKAPYGSYCIFTEAPGATDLPAPLVVEQKHWQAWLDLRTPVQHLHKLAVQAAQTPPVGAPTFEMAA